MLPREVLKWLQSLDLSLPIRNTRRDFSNGYLIAEIFSWYYPKEIQMHSFDNGTSIETKTGNWSIITRFFQRQEFVIPREEIEGTIHCKPAAAQLLVQRIYAILTNRKVSTLPNEVACDFSDRQYQESLPYHARSTATQAIKNNIANSEFVTDPDRILCGQKAQDIIQVHFRNRQQERKEDPDRFGIKPTLCEKSPRKPADGCVQEVSDEMSRMKIRTAERFVQQEMRNEEPPLEISVKQHTYQNLAHAY
eukprot:TCONS_00055543-protein